MLQQLTSSLTENPHRGFAFVSYNNRTSALDAVDNMHRNVLPGPSNAARVLKVNMAKPPKGQAVSGSNRASESFFRAEEAVQGSGRRDVVWSGG